MLSLINLDENKFVQNHFRKYYIFIEMKLFLSIVIIYVQFNKLVAIASFFFFPFSLSRSLVRSFVHSLTRSFVLSNSMILDKLRHKIIIELNSLCPAVSHLMKQVKMIFFSCHFLMFFFLYVYIYMCKIISGRIFSNDY